MKKKTIIIILSAIVVLLSILCACGNAFGNGANEQGSESETQSPATDSDARIKELEAQIVALMQSQQLSETERKKEIAALSAELERLKKDNSEQKEPSKTETEAVDSFKYTLENGKAIINEISPVGDTVTIPATIDGYEVYSIGSEALSSKTVKSVIISDGIEKLDWFAFRNCGALASVSIPNSVTSIGYGAFDNTAKSFTIICTRGSFAQQYAQSYGITYDIT